VSIKMEITPGSCRYYQHHIIEALQHLVSLRILSTLSTLQSVSLHPRPHPPSYPTSPPTMPSYLIAGASRGLGLALVQQLASQDTTSVVYAGVRTLSSFNFKHDKVNPVQLDITSDTSVVAAASEVKGKTGSIDIVIINAAIALGTHAKDSPSEDLAKSLETNTVGAFRVINAFLPLVRASTAPAHEKKIVALGSSAGSFGVGGQMGQIGVPLGVYGVSKAATHFLMMNLAIELKNEGIVTGSISPGIVETDMAAERMALVDPEVRGLFEKMGMVLLTAGESAKEVLGCVDRIGEGNTGSFVEWKDGGMVVVPF
jgi:NAD(P)-dependent dehydrogenase (short-subunit alcohol dehydrogenase family)